MELPIKKQEKTLDNVKGLARKVFGVRWFAGRVNNYGKNVFVWSRGLIPQIVVNISSRDNEIYVCNKRYKRKAERFAEKYKQEFLQEVRLIQDY